MVRISQAIPILICLMSLVHIMDFLSLSMHYEKPGVTSIAIPPIWTAVTCSFIEPSIVRLLVSVSVLFITLSTLESVWPPNELLLFLLFSVGVPGVLLWILGKIFSLFVSPVLFPVCGCTGLIVSSLLGYRHVFPYREIVNLKKLVPGSLLNCMPCGGVVQARHLPFSLVFVELVLSIFWPSYFPDSVLASMCLVTAWVYIRYLMNFPYANERGDHSSEFGFSMLVPKVIRGHVVRGTDPIYVWVVCRVKWFELRAGPSSVLYSPTTNCLEDADETRKKQAAFNVLDETIAMTREEIAEV